MDVCANALWVGASSLEGRIADVKVPRIVEFRESIPRYLLGRILRNYLMENDSSADLDSCVSGP